MVEYFPFKESIRVRFPVPLPGPSVSSMVEQSTDNRQTMDRNHHGGPND